jgi:hypothetical protein
MSRTLISYCRFGIHAFLMRGFFSYAKVFYGGGNALRGRQLLPGVMDRDA